MEQIRACLRHVHTKRRSPRTTNQNHFALIHPACSITCNLEAILGQACNAQRRKFFQLLWRPLAGIALGQQTVTAVSPAGAALVPLDDCELLCPRAIDGIGIRSHRIARAAVHDQHHWIGAVAAIDRDPLFDPPDQHKLLFVDFLGNFGSWLGVA